MISDSSPLTKADGKHILEVMNQVLLRLDSVAEELHGELHEVRIDIKASEERIKADFQRGIGIVSEHVAGANADKLSQYQDRLDDHDQRLVALEGASAGR